MVWLKGIKENVAGTEKDIEKLSGYDRGYVVVVLCSFDLGSDWAPYAHKGDMERLVKEVAQRLAHYYMKGKSVELLIMKRQGS
jgi:hypothetical protein